MSAQSDELAEQQGEKRLGRPRSAEVDRAILDAALELLVEHGYGGVSMEAIATRAGVGKAAIYRRWSNKAELVVDALREAGCATMPMPDTGDVRADLIAMLTALQESVTGRDGQLMITFMSEKLRYPELREEFERTFVLERREHVQYLVRKAVEQGLLPPDADVDLIAEAGPAMLTHRYLLRSRDPEPDLPARIVGVLFSGSPAEVKAAASRA